MNAATIKPRRTYWAIFNRFELPILGEAVADMSASGANDFAVRYWAPRLPRPASCTVKALAFELSGYGAWDAEELADDAANWGRIIWTGAHGIKDEAHEKAREALTERRRDQFHAS